jgi:hypothetical protein
MRVRRHPVVMRPDWSGVPIRADPSLAELGNVDVVVLPPILDGLDDSLAAHPGSDRVAEKPRRRRCSADVAQTLATNAATKAMVAAAQQTLCPDTLAPAGPPSTP